MKSKALFFTTAALVAASTLVHAADGTWNGGAGNWDTTDTNWTGVSAGTPWDSANGSTNKAIFGGTAGAVTLSSGVFANALQFDTTGYTISGANTLTLAGITPTVTVSNLADVATISSVVSGAAGLSKAGDGTLLLTGANNYTGGTSITGGTLQIGDGTANGTYNGTYAIGSGATLRLARASANGSGFAWGNVSGAGTLSLFTTASGVASGLWGDSTLGAGFTGTLKIEKGRVSPAVGGLGNASSVVVQSGGQIAFYNYTSGTVTQNFTLAGSGYGEAGHDSALRINNSGTVTYSGSVTLTGNTTISGAGIANFSNVISGSGDLSFGTSSGVSTVVLSGANANTLAGATILKYGRLELSKTGGAVAIQGDMILGSLSGRVAVGMNQDNQFGPNSVVRFTGSGTNSGALELNGTTQTIAGLDTTGFTGGATIVQHRENTSLAAVDATSHLIIDVAAGNSFTFGHGSGVAVIRDYNGGTLSLTKRGAGTQILNTNPTGNTGTYIYTGNTSVEGGTLQFAKAASFYFSGTGTLSGANAQKLTVSSGATAAFNVGAATYFNSTDINTLLTNSTGGKGFLAGSKLGLDTTNAGGSFTHSSAIADTANGALGLNKLGTGTLVLSGTNTYTGGTSIAAGTLSVGSGVSVNVGAGANGVALTASGATLSVDGTLVLTSGSASITTVAGSIVGGTGVLDLSGLFNTLNGGNSTTYNLITGAGTKGGSFSILGGSYDTNVWGSVSYDAGVLTFTAVPEPSTYGLIGAGALAGVAFVRRRRKHTGKVAA